MYTASSPSSFITFLQSVAIPCHGLVTKIDRSIIGHVYLCYYSSLTNHFAAGQIAVNVSNVLALVIPPCPSQQRRRLTLPRLKEVGKVEGFHVRIRITVRVFTDGCVGGAVVLPIKLGWTYSFATRKLFGHRNSLIPRPNVTVLSTTKGLENDCRSSVGDTAVFIKNSGESKLGY